jgi:uncharacterized protein YjbI with pentapeptide repeats
MKVHDVAEPIEATRANLSGSTFTKLAGSRWNNVNLSGLRITDANLSHASIAESCTEGMTIDGIAVADLMAAYRAANGKG